MPLTEVTDDYCFSYAHGPLKNNPLKRAQAYLRAKYLREDGSWICFIGGETKTGDFEVHHVGNRFDHRAGMLRVACCNHNRGHHDVDRGMVMPYSLSEREKDKETSAPVLASADFHALPSSEETARSSRMTWRYRQQLFHPRTGMTRDAGTVVELKVMADVLEERCEEGKAQSYERYLRHDAAIGYFRLFQEDGKDKLERTRLPYPLKRLGLFPRGTVAEVLEQEGATK